MCYVYKAVQNTISLVKALNSNSGSALTNSRTLVMCFPMSRDTGNMVKKSFSSFEVALVKGDMHNAPRKVVTSRPLLDFVAVLIEKSLLGRAVWTYLCNY